MSPKATGQEDRAQNDQRNTGHLTLLTASGYLEPIVGTRTVIICWNLAADMALEGKGRLIQAEASRTLIYVSQKVAGDSAWPFKAGDELLIRIDTKGKRVIVEKIQ
ncbi:MAG: hypothetical protein ABR562_02275 [Thermoplasmatota archaeon]|nr:hypothetical protein [Halobacteriales archaeon]